MAQAKFYVQVHTQENPEHPFTFVFEDINVALDVARQIDERLKGDEGKKFVAIACEFKDERFQNARNAYSHLTYLYWGGPEKRSVPSKIVKEIGNNIYLTNS